MATVPLSYNLSIQYLSTSIFTSTWSLTFPKLSNTLFPVHGTMYVSTTVCGIPHWCPNSYLSQVLSWYTSWLPWSAPAYRAQGQGYKAHSKYAHASAKSTKPCPLIVTWKKNTAYTDTDSLTQHETLSWPTVGKELVYRDSAAILQNTDPITAASMK